MLAVYGLRREEFSTLEAARLMDGYARRMRWEAQVLAAAVWGALGGGEPNEVEAGAHAGAHAGAYAGAHAGAHAMRPNNRDRVGAREFLERAGAKIWD